MDSVCRVVHLSLCYKALPCAPEAGQRSRRCGLFLIVSTILWIHSTLVTEASRSKICFQLDSYTYKFHSSFTAQYVLQKWSARAVMKWCNHLLHRDTCYDIFGPSPQIIIIIAFFCLFSLKKRVYIEAWSFRFSDCFPRPVSSLSDFKRGEGCNKFLEVLLTATAQFKVPGPPARAFRSQQSRWSRAGRSYYPEPCVQQQQPCYNCSCASP